MKQTEEVFTPELIRKWEGVGEPTSVPVFIIGMMRSGSTLVEQILASHPEVFGGGELKLLAKLWRAYLPSRGGASRFRRSRRACRASNFGVLESGTSQNSSNCRPAPPESPTRCRQIFYMRASFISPCRTQPSFTRYAIRSIPVSLAFLICSMSPNSTPTTWRSSVATIGRTMRSWRIGAACCRPRGFSMCTTRKWSTI